MIQIHCARPQERAAAETLWTQAFGDGPDFQRDFFRLCAPEGPLVLTEDGELRSMLSLPELSLLLEDGKKLRAGYVYAVATQPDCRGQGWAGMLLETAAGLAQNRGLDCLLTVPAEKSLFSFYQRHGFQPGFYRREVTAQPAPAPAEPLTPAGYAALREKLLAGRSHTAYTESQLMFQQGLCPRPGSGLYRLELAHGPGCAAVENWPEEPSVKELLCAPGDEGQGAAACAALCGAAVRSRFPAPPGPETAFGAVRWLWGRAPGGWTQAGGWLGLAFD